MIMNQYSSKLHCKPYLSINIVTFCLLRSWVPSVENLSKDRFPLRFVISVKWELASRLAYVPRVLIFFRYLKLFYFNQNVNLPFSSKIRYA